MTEETKMILEAIQKLQTEMHKTQSKLDTIESKQDSMEIELLRFKADTKEDLQILKHETKQINQNIDSIYNILVSQGVTDISKTVLYK